MTSYSLHWFGSGRVRRFGCAVAVFTYVACVSAPRAEAQNNTQRGATLGGITGAIAGAIIGDNNGEAGAGAAIGGALGVVAGGMLGNASDKDVAYRNHQYARQQQYQAQQRMAATTYVPQAATGAVSFSDVIAMSRSGVSPNVILNQISTRGVQRQPTVSDIISLHEQGVSEMVISAMQQAPVGNQLPAGNAVQSTTIVETPVFIEPRPVHYHHRHHRHIHRGRPHYYGH